MKLPWVSRKRYRKSLRRIQHLERENEKLKQELIVALSPLSPMNPLTPGTDLSKVQPITGRPTLAMITAQADRAARQRAINKEPSIVQELNEARFMARKDASGHN